MVVLTIEYHICKKLYLFWSSTILLGPQCI